MNTTPNDPRQNPNGEIERARLERAAGHASPESAGSQETFPERTKKPGQVGLANEARPGLGTRGDEPPQDDGSAPLRRKGKKQTASSVRFEGEPKATRYGYSEPLPAPREQEPDTMAHEQERQTGASGHLGMP
jgi:hypothetical protein